MRTQTTSFQRSLLSGLFIYLIISCSDGALLFIPVMVFYWFLSALLLAKPLINLEFSKNGLMQSTMAAPFSHSQLLT